MLQPAECISRRLRVGRLVPVSAHAAGGVLGQGDEIEGHGAAVDIQHSIGEQVTKAGEKLDRFRNL